MNNNKGLFITFEGPDGSGKTTQALLLKEYLELKGYEVIHTREPGGETVAEEIRKLLLSPEFTIAPLAELFLYSASRAQHIAMVIAPALAAGKIVVCERFMDATVAYQGYGRGLDKKLIKKLNTLSGQGIVPDITFLLDIPSPLGLKRAEEAKGKKDRFEKENIAFHKRVRKGYLSLAKTEPRRIKKIIVGSSIEDVHSQIVELLEQRLT